MLSSVNWPRGSGKTNYMMAEYLLSIWKENKKVRKDYPDFKDFYAEVTKIRYANEEEGE